MSKFLAVILIVLIWDGIVIGQTSGPSQPEVQSFQPIGADNLVDLFTGDFQYNIPLLDIGGFPINIFYSSNVSMEDEASYVGLGWNLNVGSINRSVRGLPDDFKGEEIIKEFNIKPNRTIGVEWGIGGEVFGLGSDVLGVGINAGAGLNYNNFKGIGIEMGISPGLNAGQGAKGNLTANLGLSSMEGPVVGLNPSVDMSGTMYSKDYSHSFGMSLGAAWDSREGMKDISFRGSFSNKSLKSQDFGAGVSGKVGYTVSFAKRSFTPKIEMPMVNYSLVGDFKLGQEWDGSHAYQTYNGYFSSQKLKEKRYSVPAYGYLYAQEAGDGKVLHDFNREKDAPYRKAIPGLPLTVHTYDVYTATGPGMGGTFRPFRGDVGIVFDPRLTNDSGGGNLGLELGLGNAVKGGMNLRVNYTQTTSGNWTWGNLLSPFVQFKKREYTSPDYEPFFFKKMGELSGMQNEDFFHTILGFQPIDVPVSKEGIASNLFESIFSLEQEAISTGLYRKNRELRSTNFSFLTAEEASIAGVEKEIRNYVPGDLFLVDDFGSTVFDPIFTRIDRVSEREQRMPHHISEITITKENGIRYVYGIPVYNKYKKEVSFNISKAEKRDPAEEVTLGEDRVIDDQNKLVSYREGDNSSHNNNGVDDFYSSEETPAYAYAYLLTAILSADYMDLTGNGPSPDDLGSYTKFNYSKIHDRFGWRAPYERWQAGFAGGLKNKSDEQANYVYGEKEIWFIHSIETKNYFASFQLSERADALGVTDENGGNNPAARLMKLDKIQLYTKTDLIHNGSHATPIKTVHFEYDYSLCPEIPANSRESIMNGGTNVNEKHGKLTLKRLYFTYRNSQKGSRSPYSFHYHENVPGENPPYNRTFSDRWGVYKDPITNPGHMSNGRFPYTVQGEREVSDKNASAWLLKEIKLPSASILKIEYESDDYAFVQNRPAMQMFTVRGFLKNPDSPVEEINNKLYQGGDQQQFLLFDLPQNLEYGDTTNLFDYVRGINELFFDFEVNVKSINRSSDNEEDRKSYEKIKGFVKTNFAKDGYGRNYGIYTGEPARDSKYGTAWIRMNNLMADDDSGSGDYHPISKATWQFLRNQLPEVAFHQSSVDDRLLEQAFKALIGIANQMNLFAGIGFYKRMEDDHRGKFVNLNKSFIRLNHVQGRKAGGGVRVKKLSINDQWGQMVKGAEGDDLNFEYGVHYEYTAEGPEFPNKTISSGVASYEPMIGTAENPFSLPDRYRIRKMLLRDDHYYMMEPFGESFYPSPQVGYSRVKTIPIKKEESSRSGKGFTIDEFFTSKDFPVLVLKSPPRKKDKKINIPPFHFLDWVTTSQGYVIELNNMNGKHKAQRIFQEGDTINPISGTQFIYNTDPGSQNRLNNEVFTINEKGEVRMKNIGVEYDFVLDFREQQSMTYSGGSLINSDFFFGGPVPVDINTVWTSLSTETVQFRSVVATKVIHRTGILSEVVSYNLGSHIRSKNIAFDDLTGNILVSNTINEFGDPVYSINVPAYWIYDGMGQASRNSGITYKNLRLNNGVLSPVPDAGRYFFPGDKLLMIRTDAEESGLPIHEIGWVSNVGESSVTVMNAEDGFPGDGPGYIVDVTIIRSGYRNQQSVVAEQVTAKTNPLQGDHLLLDQVISASAAEYSEEWQGFTSKNVRIKKGECECEVMNRNHWILQLLNNLAAEGDLYSPGFQILPNLRYRDFDVYLKESLDAGVNPVQFRSAINGSTYSAEFERVDDRGGSVFTLTMKFTEGPFFPDNITSFSEIEGVRNNPLLCNDIYDFKITADISTESGTSQEILSGHSACFLINACDSREVLPEYLCTTATGEIKNPYRLGVRGLYKPLRTWTYLTERTSGEGTRFDGTYTSFESFWDLELPEPFLPLPTPVEGFDTEDEGLEEPAYPENWIWVQKNTISDPFGFVRESQDILGRYSSSLYGYSQSVQTASASLAKYNQIAFESFEDLNYENRPAAEGECPDDIHWGLKEKYPDKVTNETSHTGRYSFKVNSREEVFIENPVWNIDGRISDGRAVRTPFRVFDDDLISGFQPDPGEYMITGWIKELKSLGWSDRLGGLLSGATLDPVYAYDDVEIRVEISGSGGFETFTIHTTGDLIDDWQRISGTFRIREGANSIRIALIGGETTTWFDDLRIHPVRSMMNSFIYDPLNLRLMAELDVNNYATFYEYNEEGALERIKKETGRGVMSLSEIRAGIAKE